MKNKNPKGSPHVAEGGKWKPDLNRFPYAPEKPGEGFVKVCPVMDKMFDLDRMGKKVSRADFDPSLTDEDIERMTRKNRVIVDLDSGTLEFD